MKFNRLHVLAAAAGLAVAVWGIWWFGVRDISLSANFKKERLDKVIAFFEKKTGLQIETNLDPATPVTLFLQDAGVGDALDTLAVAVDGRCNLYAVVAATQSEVKNYISGLVTSTPVPDWTIHRVPVPGLAMVTDVAVQPDPRTLKLAVPDAWPKGGLQVHLKTLAESSDAIWAAPTSWDPALKYNPGKVSVDEAFSKLVGSAKAKGQMFVFLRSGFRGGEGGPPMAGGMGGEGGSGGEGRRTREMPDTAVITRRVEQQIAALPQAEQATARAEWNKERAFWEELRNLSPEERRARMQERMNDPAMQEKMENAQANRDAKTSPDKRRDRYRSYLSRKGQAKGG